MENVKQKRLELLEETVAYYSENPSERRCIKDGACKYSPKTLGLEKSEGCAIGRKLNPEKALEIDRQWHKDMPSDVEAIFPQLPNELQKLGITFLLDLQGFHDMSIYWSEKSITESGKQEVERIKAKYC